jgi:uncharacterized OB-fold protein
MENEYTGAAFDKFLSEEKLMGTRCKACGALYLPPRPICTKCNSRDMEWVEMKGKGKLSAFTTICVGTTIMAQEGCGRDNPYCCGIVELEEGVKISGRILGVDTQKPENIKVGTPLSVEFVHRGEGENKKTFLGFRAN